MSTGYSGNVGLKQEAVFGEEASPPEVFEEIVNESMMMESEQIKIQMKVLRLFKFKTVMVLYMIGAKNRIEGD